MPAQPKNSHGFFAAGVLSAGILDRLGSFANHRIDPSVAHHCLALAHLAFSKGKLGTTGDWLGYWHLCVHSHIYIYIHIYNIYTQIGIYTCICKCIYTWSCKCMCIYIYYVTHVYISISTCKFKIYRYIHIDACRMYPLLLANSFFFASFLPVFIVDRVDLRHTDWETSSKLCASIPMLDSDFREEIPMVSEILQIFMVRKAR